ncbi:MAG: hypothetical protein DVS81_17290 [Candidatus Accumulibacter meliphilus]|uniref:Uncharacterized protein n=1 Tax=Candidatus Accumulibacter meliphilus TaxID=2211374 RepID=A0A369XHH1_9PROT|nr:MAG: hypothetical protein DVS81_17290 [Candidatus Accumulibacter meliphilus]
MYDNFNWHIADDKRSIDLAGDSLVPVILNRKQVGSAPFQVDAIGIFIACCAVHKRYARLAFNIFTFGNQIHLVAE